MKSTLLLEHNITVLIARNDGNLLTKFRVTIAVMVVLSSTLSASLREVFTGRQAATRRRAHAWVMSILEQLLTAAMLRGHVDFLWNDLNVCQSMKSKLLDWFISNDLIVEYSRGWSFDDSQKKRSRFYPSFEILSQVSYTGDVDSREEIRIGDSSKYGKTDSFLKKHAKKMQSRVNVPITRMKRIYTNDYLHGGRVYSHFQNMRASDRVEQIKIDNERVAELDYRNNHLSILLNKVGRTDNRDLYALFSDLYLDRSEIKKAVAIRINASKPVLALTSNRGDLQWTIEQANEFIERMDKEYPEIHSFKLGKDLGLKLQKIEGDIVVEMFKRLPRTCILPVHDSFITKQSDTSIVSGTMQEVWNDVVSKSNWN